MTAPNSVLLPPAFGVIFSSLEKSLVAREESLRCRFREPKEERLAAALVAVAAIMLSSRDCCSRSFLRRSKIILFRSWAVTSGDNADCFVSLSLLSPPFIMVMVVKQKCLSGSKIIK